MAVSTQFEKAKTLLRTHFGYDDFRAGQKPVVDSLLQGRDTVGIMPTGGGKSICYQIPALVQSGITLVISPLISLMKDQVDALSDVGIEATFINSSLPYDEIQRRMSQCAAGRVRLLYVSPERLEDPYFLRWVDVLSPALIAVDEAHCLSQWGHDFRKSYRAIPDMLKQLSVRPVIAAFTATATPDVIDDIVTTLGLRRPNVFISGFDRENLRFSVVVGMDKRTFVETELARHPNDSGIIYAATRKEVDSLYQHLKKRGIAVGRYHGGMSDADRNQSQEQFLYDDVRIMVATNAFGMGIDKSNVRFVLHVNIPKSLEAYYQEAGRAGRDGLPGECVLLFQAQDVMVQKFLIQQSEASEERKVHDGQKLQAMIDYCHTSGCLRAFILRYFGETGEANCGNCNHCDHDFDVVDGTVIAQKIFSCVHRLKARFGVKIVAGVLRGSKDKRIQSLHLDALPTYGVLKTHKEKEVVGYIQTLIADGYMQLTNGQYPVVQLCPSAVAVLKGEAKVMFRVEKREEQVMAVDDGLFEELRVVRRTLAGRFAVPPYIIFADSTLREMANACPQDKASMLRVKGVGDAKFERYGAEFLAVCQTWQATHSLG